MIAAIRYAIALHTDEPHPHVHLVLKATAEGRLYRLNIRKPMLREWRQEFARHLCALGVPAKATRRAERRKTTKLPGIYGPVSQRFGPAVRKVERRSREL